MPDISFIKVILIYIISLFLSSCNQVSVKVLPRLQISENRRYIVTEKNEPFFWLGDTGWLLFTKLNREDAEKYFTDRQKKGFNVIQVMVLHNIRKAVNIYGDSALVNCQVDKPFTTPGDSFDDSEQYDFWDHVDYLVNLAGRKGLYLAMVPVWGSNVKSGKVTVAQAGTYAKWLAERYKDKSNIIWLNGGDINGSDSSAIWQKIGSVIKRYSPDQLMSFHPFGRTQSSKWFHNEAWLDFNMFQSGHRRYDQDTTGLRYGEDNWKYAADDYSKLPVKPTLDGEPSYEGIPQGLHDTSQPLWTAADVSRYAYWSVFAGGCGFTYGNNAIMQFHKNGDTEISYGVKQTWDTALYAPGASQMIFLKKLMLSRDYFARVPAQELIAGNQGEKHDYIAATRGKDYAFIYTCNGNTMNIDLGNMKSVKIKATWYNPVNGDTAGIGVFNGNGIKSFDPPGNKAEGNQWVLILDRIL